MRPGIKWAVAGVAVLCLAGLFWHLRGRSGSSSGPGEPAVTAGRTVARPGPQAARSSVSADPAGAPRPVPVQPDTATVASAAGQAAAPAPTPAIPQVPVDPTIGALVAGLNRLSGTNTPLTAESAAAWRANFMNLVQAGPAAIPALRAFLDQKVDYPFGTAVWQTLGYGSARLAALDALRQIGGPDAVSTMEGLLGTTKTPKEIATLARNLEEAGPGQYRQQALEAARSGLAAALTSGNPQLDVAPLFEVFQYYGDASVIPELEKAMDQWKYYATIALANLPENAGVPTLLRLADASVSSGNRVVALEMVAQLAATNPDARQFLAAQIANKSIPPNLWPYLTSPLSGDQYFPVDSAITPYPQLQSWSDLKTTHLANGNQNLYNLPGNQNLTAEGIQQRLALVDELLRVATDPAAVQTLQRARDTLSQRSTRAVAQTPPAAAGQ